VVQKLRGQSQKADVIVILEMDDPQQLVVLQQAFVDKGLTPLPRFVVGREPYRSLPVGLQRDVTYVDINPLRRAGLITAVAIAAGRASPEPYTMPTATSVSNLIAPSVDEALDRKQLILVAEDHEANRQVLRRQLNRMGYACEIANDGVQALAMWNSKPYALLLTDCHMPELDGFGLTDAIRQMEAGTDRRAPIVAITANVLQGEAERCLAAGMDDFLPKPAEITVLKATLEKWIGAPVGAKPAPAPGPAPALRPVPGEPVLDLTIMSQTFGEINDEARDMLKLFVDSIRPLIDKFETEFGDLRLESACQTIHKARGAAANAGGKELAGVMGRIEAALIADDLAAAREHSLAVRPAWERLLAAIASA
jgi:CheY-like chemotaxis protein/HPt (histidine-containing phosphotransfer) domain-containing protein